MFYFVYICKVFRTFRFLTTPWGRIAPFMSLAFVQLYHQGGLSVDKPLLRFRPSPLVFWTPWKLSHCALGNTPALFGTVFYPPSPHLTMGPCRPQIPRLILPPFHRSGLFYRQQFGCSQWVPFQCGLAPLFLQPPNPPRF